MGIFKIMKNLIPIFLVIFSMIMLTACGKTQETTNSIEVLTMDQNNNQQTKYLGGISSQDALDYMKKTPNLVIVEVNAPEWKLRTGFKNALYIPYTEINRRYGEIPKNRPVLLHCGGGIVSVEAYEILKKKRPDIPELSYIAGVPKIAEYNDWLSKNMR